MKHHETVGLRLFNTIFSNISVISWQSVLLVKETGVLWGNHHPPSNHWKNFRKQCCTCSWCNSLQYDHSHNGPWDSLQQIIQYNVAFIHVLWMWHTCITNVACTDSGQKYSAAADFPYEFHIKLIFQIIILRSTHVWFSKLFYQQKQKSV